METKPGTAAKIDRSAFLCRFGYTEDQFKQTGLEWPQLEELCHRHSAMVKELHTTATGVSERLQAVPQVHSLKVRVKDGEHLIEKIIRKKLHRPDDFTLDCSNYEERITDLVGVRALHLFKDEWKEIHEFVTRTWELNEDPIAYVREGDPEELQKRFSAAGCRVEQHPFGYRSVHYLIKSYPTKCVRLVELQVRTIFEEGWSEIDHKVRYPHQTDSPQLATFLTIFNRLAGSADEMGTFTKMLDEYLREQTRRSEENLRQLHQKEAELQKTISQLKITSQEKADLQRQITNLKPIQLPEVNWPKINVSGSILEFPSVSLHLFICSNCGKSFAPRNLAGATSRPLCEDCALQRILTIKPIV